MGVILYHRQWSTPADDNLQRRIDESKETGFETPPNIARQRICFTGSAKYLCGTIRKTANARRWCHQPDKFEFYHRCFCWWLSCLLSTETAYVFASPSEVASETNFESQANPHRRAGKTNLPAMLSTQFVL